MKCSFNLNGYMNSVFLKLNKQNAQQKKIKAICNNPPTKWIHPQTDTWWKPLCWRHEWNWTKYFFGFHKTEECLVFNALLSLGHERKKNNPENAVCCAACSLLNSVSHLPLIQPDTANFGIRVWNENQYLFWAWKQSDCSLGRAWPGTYFQWSVRW